MLANVYSTQKKIYVKNMHSTDALKFSIINIENIFFQPKSILQIQTHLIIKSLRRDSTSERGASLLQFVYMLLNSGRGPLALSYEAEEGRHCDALRALMFRIQLMLCSRVCI